VRTAGSVQSTRENGAGSPNRPAPLHLQPGYAHLGIRAGAFPESEKAAHEVLAIPIHPGLRPGDLEYVAEQIHALYNQ
jgi:dTDP-4-amino-4,6-dideoxygalactose transaminase